MKKSKLVANTQIYLDCRRLMDAILDITINFPRSFKFSIGSKMHELGVSLIKEIQHLIDFQSDFEVLKLLIRIAGERKWIQGRGRHADIIEIMDTIGKQSTAWKNSLLKIDDKKDNEYMPEPGD